MVCDFLVGEWLVQPALNSVRANGRAIHVEPKVMEVLACLARHAGEVVSKEHLIQSVWPNTFVSDDVLVRSISELRKTFRDDPAEPRFIQTIAKRGYRLIAPVEWSDGQLGVDQVGKKPHQGREKITEGGQGDGKTRLGRLLMGRWAVASGLVCLAVIATYAVWYQFARHAKPPSAGRITLVVLPFENLSGDSDEEYLSDGVTEETTMQLARLHPERLGVTGRATAMTYKYAHKTIEEIGKELGVQYVLEGSVRRAGNRVRISAQLVEVRHQTHVWAQNYDQDFGDVLALQDDVARDVAGKLGITLAVEGQPRSADPKRVIPRAYEAYLRGRYFWNRRTPDEIRTSIGYFRQALRDDSDFALAYAGLAESLALTGKPEATAEAKSVARKAIQLDGTLGEPHAALAFIALQSDWDWEVAEREFRRAIELNPSDSTAHHWLGIYFEEMGRLQEATGELNRALELEPLSLIIRAKLADVLSEAGRSDKALEEVRKVSEMDPRFAEGHRVLVWIYERKGMLREAMEELYESRQLGIAEADFMADLGYIQARAGDRVAAERCIQYLEHRAIRSDERPPAGDIAQIYVGLGDVENAFKWLERARVWRIWGFPQSLRADPAFDHLRSDPRFRALLLRMNFRL